MDKLRQTILAEEMNHGSIPFWSWNDKLEDGELRRQIGNMHDLKMKGFFMHARGGLETEYLSDEWFHAVETCVREAEKLGMEAWSYDEYGWPSGFAGGILLRDRENLAAFLTAETGKAYPVNDPDVLAVFRKTEDGMEFLPAFSEGNDFILIRRGYDESYVDTLNPEITRKFIGATHEVYEKRLSAADFGTVMPGFFTDEPQYYRWNTPYSDTLPAIFEKEYGYPLIPGLAALFFDYDGAEEFRYDYYLLLHRLFTNGFIRPIYEWCGEHGVKITGHAVEESSLSGQMMCCGGVMPFYEYEHIPGIDYLGRGIANALAPKQLGSVCAQLGKKYALSEMFACCGWDVTPGELKRIAEMQYANGVNLMCQHLYSYSIRGQRKRDYPCHYSDHNPWQKYLLPFNTYFNRLGAALSVGEEYAPVLVLHPIRSAYLHYIRFQDKLGRLDGELDRLVRTFTERQIPYHFGDETLLAKYGKADGNEIVLGNCRYSVVVLPDCETIDRSTAALLREFLAAGGKLAAFGRLPDRIDGRKADLSFLKPNMSLDELDAVSGLTVRTEDGKNAYLHTAMRKTEEGRLIFLANTGSGTFRDLRVNLKSAAALSALDLNTMTYLPLRTRREADGSCTVLVSLGDSASVLLTEKDAGALPFEASGEQAYLSLPDEMRFETKPENMIVLDYADYETENGKKTGIAVMGIKDGLLRERYHGNVKLTYRFRVKEIPEKLLAVAEPLPYSSVTVNGHPVGPNGEYRLDRSFLTYDIARYAVKGENLLTFEFPYRQRDYVYYVLYGGVSESLRNCLSFDTEIEPVYLFGSFGVEADAPFTESVRGTVLCDGGFALTAQKDTVDLKDPLRDGYPFFTGEMTVKGRIAWHPGMPTVLRLGGRFAAASLTVNGKDMGDALFDDRFDLSDVLHDGENGVRLTLCNSRRNLLGPHHFPDPEPYAVGPNVFSLEKQWQDGKCGSYPDRYSFMRFGINFGS